MRVTINWNDGAGTEVFEGVEGVFSPGDIEAAQKGFGTRRILFVNPGTVRSMIAEPEPVTKTPEPERGRLTDEQVEQVLAAVYGALSSAWNTSAARARGI